MTRAVARCYAQGQTPLVERLQLPGYVVQEAVQVLARSTDARTVRRARALVSAAVQPFEQSVILVTPLLDVDPLMTEDSSAAVEQ